MYLSSCLASIEAQIMPEMKFEVLLVDDRGDDGSYGIARAWKDKCDKTHGISVKILRNECNCGSSHSRNKALRQANGRYVMFLDADDYLQRGAIEKIVNRMDKQCLDDLYFNAHSFYESLAAHRLVRENYDHRTSFNNVYTGKELFANMVNCGEFFPQGALRAYRTEFLKENNLEFSEHNIHEDLLLLVQAMLVSSRTSFLNEPIYARRVHCDSKMGRRERTIGNVSGHFETLLYFYEWMQKSCQTSDDETSNDETSNDARLQTMPDFKRCQTSTGEDFYRAYSTFMEKYGRLCARDIGWFISREELDNYLSTLDEYQRSKFYELIIDPYMKDYEKNPNTSTLHKWQRYAVLPFRGAREVILYLKERR